MSGKVFDPAAMRDMADRLEQASAKFDATGTKIPDSVDAGPFAPLVQGLIESVAANNAALVIRLAAAADQVRKAADRYEATEEANADVLRKKGDLENLLLGGLELADGSASSDDQGTGR
ncbi:MAG TPA: hypothetical protein VIL34_24255 [Actinopolymorphaceae bacterium]